MLGFSSTGDLDWFAELNIHDSDVPGVWTSDGGKSSFFSAVDTGGLPYSIISMSFDSCNATSSEEPAKPAETFCDSLDETLQMVWTQVKPVQSRPLHSKMIGKKEKSYKKVKYDRPSARTSCRLKGPGVRFVPHRCPRQLTGTLNHSGWVYCLALIGLLWTVAHASVTSAEIIKSDPKKNPYFGKHLSRKTRTDYASKTLCTRLRDW